MTNKHILLLKATLYKTCDFRNFINILNPEKSYFSFLVRPSKPFIIVKGCGGFPGR